MSEQTTHKNLTQLEERVLKVILSAASKVGKPSDIKTERNYLNVIKVCDAISLMKPLMGIGDGDVVANAIKSLNEKGLIKTMEVTGAPSFIPAEYWKEKM